MKSFIISLLLISCAVLVNGQESSTYDSRLGYSETFTEYVGTSTDILKVGDSTWTYTVLKESAKPLKYDVFLKFDATGGTNNVVNITVFGKKTLDQPSWTSLKTASWTSGADTTKTITESTTAQQYRYYKVEVKGANDTLLASIVKFFIKFWE